jgi:ABC-2 type transport system ATP-binding protein
MDRKNDGSGADSPAGAGGVNNGEINGAAAIEALGLEAGYPGKKVLRDVGLSVRSGEVYGLLGRNGSGKTTLFRTLVRLLEPLRGTIRILGEDIHSLDEPGWRRVSFIGEMAGALPHWTVKRVVAFQKHSYGRMREDWVGSLLAEFGIRQEATLGTLSRGEQQMTGLILAVSVEPDVLLLDEPAAGLDPVARRELLGRVLDLMSHRGAAVLISSHIISDLERIADRVGFLDGGRIVLEGSLDDLKESCSLVAWDPAEEPPPGVRVLRLRSGGRALVSGDQDALAGRERQPLSLEDLYVEFLGSASRETRP